VKQNKDLALVNQNMKSFLEKQIEKQKMLKERYQSTLTKYQINSIHQTSKFP
jgi:hypothetical protein